MRSVRLQVAAIALFVIAQGEAGASLITFSDRATFEAYGEIAFNSNFDDLGPDSEILPIPFTRGDVTYTSAEYLMIGTNSGVVQNVIRNNRYTPLTGTINSSHNMFGFDLGYVDDFENAISHLIDLEITTNLGTYTFLDLAPPDAHVGLSFFGFVATDPGEYFTDFRLDAQYASDESAVGPAITNIAVGHMVPEPASFVIWGTFAAVGALSSGVRRHRTRAHSLDAD